MTQVQFFLFGLLLVWFVGTGKLGSLMQALRDEPPASSPSNAPSQGNAIRDNPPLVGPTGPIGQQAAALATSQLGKEYEYGATPDLTLATLIYDCSSLVKSVYGKLGKTLPRVAADQSRAVTPVPIGQQQPGDLAFGSFAGPDSHVGIYVGNDQIVSALNEARGVATTGLNWPGLHFGRVG